jgi:spore germination protein GerM
MGQKLFSWGRLFAGAIALASLGAVAAWVTFRHTPSEPVKVENPVPVNQPTPTPKVSPLPQTQNLQVYWLKVTPEKTSLFPAQVNVVKDGQKRAPLELALQALLEIPNDSDYSTFIPPGTKLLGVREGKDGIHINLSAEFAQGEGPTALMARLGQVIYTATSQDPQAQVWLEVEGKPLELMGGGEGLMVEQPLTRQSFEQDYQL